MFSDLGIAANIVQSDRGFDTNFLNTAWTLQVVRGFILWFASCLLALPYANLFYSNDAQCEQLVFLVPVASFIAVINGFQSTNTALWYKKMEFRSVAFLDLVSQIVALGVTLTWAWLNPSIWALVVGLLAGATTKLIISHQCNATIKHEFCLQRDSLRELVHFGKWVFLSTLFTFIAGNLDRIILGRVLSLGDLGLYSIASVFCRAPLNLITKLSGSVLYSAFATHKNNSVHLSRILLRSREGVLALGGGACVSLAIGSRLFFQSLWDARYHDAASIVHWLTIYIWSLILVASFDRFPLALGNSRALFYSNVIRASGIIISVFGYNVAGIPGFVLGLTCGSIFTHIQLLYHARPVQKQIVSQSLTATLIWLIIGTTGIMISEFCRAHSSFQMFAIVTVALALAPPMLVISYAWKRFVDVIRKTRNSDKTIGVQCNRFCR